MPALWADGPPYMVNFAIEQNLLTGTWASAVRCFSSLTSLRTFSLVANLFTGTWDNTEFSRKKPLVEFQIGHNAFTGTWPPESLSGLTVVITFVICRNDFEGDWPTESMGSMHHLQLFHIYMNRFKAAWTPHCLRKLSALQEFEISRNLFAGTWPSDDICKSSPWLSSFNIEHNNFTGLWHAETLGSCSGLKFVFIRDNKFAGTWPPDALRACKALQQLVLAGNHFTGAWPEEERTGHFTALSVFSNDQNKFEGTWSQHALPCASQGLLMLYMASNCFTGTFPEECSRGHTQLARLVIAMNRFAGTWPTIAVSSATSLAQLQIWQNKFAGPWPASALSSAATLVNVVVGQNHFAGTWPEEGLRACRGLQRLYISSNCFVGSFPQDALRTFTSLANFLIGGNEMTGTLAVAWPLSAHVHITQLALQDTRLEGALPERLSSMSRLRLFRAGGTRIEGAIPGRFGARQPVLEMLSLRDLLLEGVLPRSLSRLQIANLTVVVGLGLRGNIPPLAGTYFVLSAFRNSFEGFLPGLRLQPASVVAIHSNLLSCALPVHEPGGSKTSQRIVAPTLDIVLLGNYFKQPQLFPSWISSFERGEFFTVSDRHAFSLTKKVVFGMVSLAAVLIWRQSQVEPQVLSSLRRWKKLDVLYRALHMALITLAGMLAFAASALALFTQFRTLACVTVLGRLRLPVLLHSQATSLQLVQGLLWIRTVVGVRSFATWRQMTMRSLGHKGKSPRARKRIMCSIWGSWLLLCLLASMPGILYSMLKAVPGYLHTSNWLRLTLTQGVSLLTACATSLLLPRVAELLQEASAYKGDELLSVGKLLAVPMLPCLAIFVFDEHCLGQWSTIWDPCVSTPSPLDGLEHVLLPYYKGSRMASGEKGPAVSDRWFYESLVERKVICERGHMAPRRCIDAAIAWANRFLIANTVHVALTVPSMQLAAFRTVKLGAAWVDLARIWELLLIFGPVLPVLSFPSALHLFVHKEFLLGGWSLLRGNAQTKAELRSGGLPQLSMRIALLCSAAMEFCILWFRSGSET